MDERLSEPMLQAMTHEKLTEYTMSLEQQLGRITVFLEQVRIEWERRFPPDIAV